MTNGGKERTALDLGAVATVTGLGKQRKNIFWDLQICAFKLESLSLINTQLPFLADFVLFCRYKGLILS